MASGITLISCDDEVFEVDKTVAMESQTIKHMIEVDCVDSGIPLPNVNSKILFKVIEYCQKHVEAGAAAADEELKSWDAEFVRVDQATLFDLMLAANYLNIWGLLDLTGKTIADMIKGKTPEEIRKTFNLKKDFTPEEEELIRLENPQAANYRNIMGLLRLTVRAVGHMIRGNTFNIQNDWGWGWGWGGRFLTQLRLLELRLRRQLRRLLRRRPRPRPRRRRV